MQFDNYQRLAVRTRNIEGTINEQLANMALGLCGEAGELAEKIKKIVFHRHPMTVDRKLAIREELGDVQWYLANIADVLDMELQTIAAENIAKLRIRYPSGFSSADSIARVDTDEVH